MKTMFPLALLCLLFSSCTKEYSSHIESAEAESRALANISVTYTLPNGSQSTVECLKAESSAISSSVMSVKMYTSATNFYTLNAQLLVLSGINGSIRITDAAGNASNDLSDAKIYPFSATQTKLVYGNNNTSHSNSFIGEDTDGL